MDENDGWEGDDGMVWEPAYNPHRNNKEVLNIQSQIEAINNEIAFLQVSLFYINRFCMRFLRSSIIVSL